MSSSPPVLHRLCAAAMWVSRLSVRVSANHFSEKASSHSSSSPTHPPPPPLPSLPPSFFLPEEADNYWFAFLLFSFKRLSQKNNAKDAANSNENGFNLYQIMKDHSSLTLLTEIMIPEFVSVSGHTYNTRQLVSTSPGTPLFEIFVVKEADETYTMQVVFIQRAESNNSKATTPSMKGTSMADIENSSVIDAKFNEDRDTPSKDEFVRVPAEIEEMEKDSFVLHVPVKSHDLDSEESIASKVKIAAIASQCVYALMPPDVAKVLWSSDKVSRK
ncbi:hypothetical protein L2E82_12561 [Cichorium intybus]|uniref:Uncharacterized protein n=1 Tax=Cichorium intybus TaxID=13427 RepID=A0ACB9GGA7_CICIN|nr:hypothetical protein L2E82_12561 [Cichorium intybus]